MTTHARFVGAGVQPLVDAVKAAGADPGDLRAAVWQATWARGYDDVVAPAPAIRLKEDGFIVYSRPIGPNRYAGVIDTGHALWALVARGVLPSVGARVRIVPAFIDGAIGWDVSILETLGFGLTVRFGTRIDETTTWIDLLRKALARIAGAEAERGKAIVVERRSLITIAPVQPFPDELDALYEQLRSRVEVETAATPAERKAFDRGNERGRKAIIEEVKLRRATRYKEQLAALRSRVPELKAAHAKRMATNIAAREAVAELEDAASRTRGVSERVGTVQNQLTSVEESGLLVTPNVELLKTLGADDFDEIARTVELLYDLIPRRAQKR